MSFLNKALDKVKQVGVKVVKKLDQEFVEPSRRVKRIQDSKMKALDKKAKSGELNEINPED